MILAKLKSVELVPYLTVIPRLFLVSPKSLSTAELAKSKEVLLSTFVKQLPKKFTFKSGYRKVNLAKKIKVRNQAPNVISERLPAKNFTET